MTATGETTTTAITGKPVDKSTGKLTTTPAGAVYGL